MTAKKGTEPWERIQKRHKFISVCTICGFPITVMELAMHMQGAYATDFIEHSEVEMTMDICPECRAKIIANAKGGMKKAVKQFEQLMVMEADQYGKDNNP